MRGGAWGPTCLKGSEIGTKSWGFGVPQAWLCDLGQVPTSLQFSTIKLNDDKIVTIILLPLTGTLGRWYETPRKKVPQHRAWHTGHLTIGCLMRCKGVRNLLTLTVRIVHLRAYYVLCRVFNTIFNLYNNPEVS